MYFPLTIFPGLLLCGKDNSLKQISKEHSKCTRKDLESHASNDTEIHRLSDLNFNNDTIVDEISNPELKDEEQSVFDKSSVLNDSSAIIDASHDSSQTSNVKNHEVSFDEMKPSKTHSKTDEVKITKETNQKVNNGEKLTEKEDSNNKILKAKESSDENNSENKSCESEFSEKSDTSSCEKKCFDTKSLKNDSLLETKEGGYFDNFTVFINQSVSCLRENLTSMYTYVVDFFKGLYDSLINACCRREEGKKND